MRQRLRPFLKEGSVLPADSTASSSVEKEWECNDLPREEENPETKSDHHAQLAESQCISWDTLGTESRETRVVQISSTSSFSRLEDSDFLPSVRLAFLLLIIFVVVSLLLVHNSNDPAPSKHYNFLKSHILHPHDHKESKLKFFFPSQLDATWKTLEHAFSQGPGKSSGNQKIILLATGDGNARNTISCFSKAIISLLLMSEGTPTPDIRTKMLNYSTFLLNWTRSAEVAKQITTIAVISERKQYAPYGIIVCMQHSLDMSPLALKVTMAVLPSNMDPHEESLLHELTSELMSDILNSISQLAGAVSDMFMPKSGDGTVLFVKPEEYLENGWAY